MIPTSERRLSVFFTNLVIPTYSRFNVELIFAENVAFEISLCV